MVSIVNIGYSGSPYRGRFDLTCFSGGNTIFPSMNGPATIHHQDVTSHHIRQGTAQKQGGPDEITYLETIAAEVFFARMCWYSVNSAFALWDSNTIIQEDLILQSSRQSQLLR
jgi:hypothetical protein